MKNTMLWMLAVSGGLMMSGAGWAETTKATTPEMVEGQVTQVDMNQGKLTIRASDGTVHEFQASKETLAGYKVGDTVKAKLRKSP